MTARVVLDGDQLIATRHLAAAPALVWLVFTTPEHLAAFWGGDHATIQPGSVTVDLRVGGAFTLTTVGAGGCSYPLQFRYEVVEPPTRLVLAQPVTGLTNWPLYGLNRERDDGHDPSAAAATRPADRPGPNRFGRDPRLSCPCHRRTAPP